MTLVLVYRVVFLVMLYSSEAIYVPDLSIVWGDPVSCASFGSLKTKVIVCDLILSPNSSLNRAGAGLRTAGASCVKGATIILAISESNLVHLRTSLRAAELPDLQTLPI